MTLSDAWIDGLAGWCSGAVSVVLLQPMDTLLTRGQAGLVAWQPNAAAASSSSSSTIMTTFWKHRSATDWRFLWRGSLPMMTAVPFQNALLMGGYGLGLQYYPDVSNDDNHKHHRWWAIFVGGTLGGIGQSFLMSPVELVKVVSQCHTHPPPPPPPLHHHNHPHPTKQRYMSSLSSSSVLYRKSIFRGLGATLLRDGIPHGVWFVSYDVCKTLQLEWEGETTTTTSTTNIRIPLVSGAVAATVAWIVGYPFDVIKTRIQYQTSSMGQQTSPSLGIVGTAQQIIAESNGHWSGLYRGLGLKLVRAIPASMIGFGVYEAVKGPLERW